MEIPTPRRRPDPAVPLVAAAFALGVVISAVASLALRVDHGPQVPASEHTATVTQLAAAKAARDAAAAQVAAQGDALGKADDLARRLVAALDNPAAVTPADIAALRREVVRQTKTIERVRIVRVPVPTAPAAGPRIPPAPQQARQQPDPPDPTPTAAAPGRPCALELLGSCIAR